jgi:hypothetical protein
MLRRNQNARTRLTLSFDDRKRFAQFIILLTAIDKRVSPRKTGSKNNRKTKHSQREKGSRRCEPFFYYILKLSVPFSSETTWS